MYTLSEAQLKLLPEMSDILQIRYRLLQTIQMMGPIGRRALAEQLSVTEREVRKETDLLNEQGLIFTSRLGMSISDSGHHVLSKLKSLVHEWSGISSLETILTRQFKIQKVIIVPGNNDVEPSVKTLMGTEAANELERLANGKKTVAVTGGSTVSAIAESLTPSNKFSQLQFIAARGGIGEEMQLQANTIASVFASKTGGTYRTLYLPEYLSENAYSTMMQEPIVREMIGLYEQTDIVIHGIGSAEEMAVRRNSSPEDLQALQSFGAVGEAFGYYFDETGNAVHRIRTVGIQLEQVHKCPSILAVAGGTSKAKAILSYIKNPAEQTILITDLGAAEEMIQLLK
ncbi:sugar-binding transcriptional regulator [Viridibacillus arvi]|uniref:sugar-binding transcriptional regulator n=1 Tax=Viridibacillus arvi TaxID=263475 RepID=UPI003CFDFEF4